LDTLAEQEEEVRRIVESWIEEYNGVRPHEALQGFTPYQFATLNP
jgi:transposase InsO family protein